MDIVGSETMSSTREMYDSSCCLDSNFLEKASSLVLNLAASIKLYQYDVQKKLYTQKNSPLIMLSISVEESLPTVLEMVMLELRPEVFSVAVTLRIPLTSTSKIHSRTASPLERVNLYQLEGKGGNERSHWRDRR